MPEPCGDHMHSIPASNVVAWGPVGPTALSRFDLVLSWRQPTAQERTPRPHPVAVVSGRIRAGLRGGKTCYKPVPGAGSSSGSAPTPTARVGERRSLSEADYVGLITAAHQQLYAPLILCRDT